MVSGAANVGGVTIRTCYAYCGGAGTAIHLKLGGIVVARAVDGAPFQLVREIFVQPGKEILVEAFGAGSLGLDITFDFH